MLLSNLAGPTTERAVPTVAIPVTVMLLSNLAGPTTLNAVPTVDTPVTNVSPITCSFDVGFVVPIPVLPEM